MGFLALCDPYGSEEAAVAAIAGGRRSLAGVTRPGRPASLERGRDESAVEYLQEAGAGLTESGTPHR